MSAEVSLCACGCGGAIVAKPSGYIAKWIRNHHVKGKKRSDEWKQKQSEGVKRAWRDGKFNGKQRPDYDLISAKLRGRERGKQEMESARASIKKAWADGRYDSPETRAKLAANLEKARISENVFRGDKDYMDKIREKRDMPALRARSADTMRKLNEEWRRSGKIETNKIACRKATIGKHGFGRCARGRLDHCKAKAWKIRSPLGVIFKFTNLSEWVRKNIHMFHDYRPECRLSFEYRVFAGLKNIHQPKRRNSSTHYQGWTVLGSAEIGDLIGRDESEIITNTK